MALLTNTLEIGCGEQPITQSVPAAPEAILTIIERFNCVCDSERM